MEILFWLAPAATVTLLSMVWVGWLGRADRGQLDRDVAAQRLAKGLASRPKGLRVHPQARRPIERSSGVALRPSRTPHGGTQGEPNRERRSA